MSITNIVMSSQSSSPGPSSVTGSSYDTGLNIKLTINGKDIPVTDFQITYRAPNGYVEIYVTAVSQSIDFTKKPSKKDLKEVNQELNSILNDEIQEKS